MNLERGENAPPLSRESNCFENREQNAVRKKTNHMNRKGRHREAFGKRSNFGEGRVGQKRPYPRKVLKARKSAASGRVEQNI